VTGNSGNTNVMRHPIGHTLLIQNRKTKPATHNYSTFAGTQTLTQGNLQKSCNSANASAQQTEIY